MSKKDQSNAIRNIGKPCAEMLALATVGDCAISRDIIRWHRGKHFDEVTVLQVEAAAQQLDRGGYIVLWGNQGPR